MDLSSMLNDEGRDRQPPPSRPSQQHKEPPGPATPGQSVPPRGSYHPQGQPSPTRHMSQEFPPHHFAGSPGPYQHHPGPNPGPYVSRPAPPPPLQPLGTPDPRSPGSAAPAPAPYRQTPSGPYPSAGAFPFPVAPQSPTQRHQYPLAGQLHSRESFSHSLQQQQIQQPPTPVPPPGHPPHLQSLPQTPPVGGLAQLPQHHNQLQQQQGPYVHQRSQSSHSTSTPTSAHSQHHYSGPFPQQQASPVVANHSLPGDYPRQASQPPTPLGPPLSAGHRQSSSAGAYGQPRSPYQARISVASVNHHPHASPPPPPPPAIPRMTGSHSVYESPGATDGHRRSQSQTHSDRDRSISVSPKTRAPSIPQARSERAITPAKRKLSDVDGVEHPREAQRPAVDLNGIAVPQHLASAETRRKKRPQLYNGQPPVWACPHDGVTPDLQNGNWTLHKRGPKKDRAEEDDLSEEPPPPSQAAAPPGALPGAPPGAPRYPWDTCIAGGLPPVGGFSKAVADFLFMHVVMNEYGGEIRAHKILFEIEAKLGVVIDKRTDNRIELPVVSECVLEPSSQYAFRSSITEREHQALNGFFNSIVVETEPRNTRRDPSRLPLSYTHRREIDEFFELPQDQREQLPACVESLVPRRHAVKVRVTKDKTGQILGAIIKARVGDLHIHFPNYPLDCRLSVNLEMPWDGQIPKEITSPAKDSNDATRKAVTSSDRTERKKDRLSYKQGVFQVDLTQVTSTLPSLPTQPANVPPRVQKEHELEIELDGEELLTWGEEAQHGNPVPYANMIDALLDNVRLMALKCDEIRKSAPGHQPR